MPVRIRSHPTDPVSSYLSSKHRTKSIPPKPTVSWLISMPRSCRRSSTSRSESGNRTYSITAKRMISGLVLKYLNGECFVIRRGYETARPVSSSFCLTVPYIAKRKRQPNIKHHSQADGLRARFKGTEWGVFCHLRILQIHPARFNRV